MPPSEEAKPDDESGSSEAGKPNQESEIPKVNPSDLVADANAAAERLEKANEVMVYLLAKQDLNNVEKTLSGKAVVTEKKPTLTKDEQDLANAKEFLSGTGLEEHAFPPDDEGKV